MTHKTPREWIKEVAEVFGASETQILDRLRLNNAAKDLHTALKAVIASYQNDQNQQMIDSDLDDEQPRTLQVTLGDIRKAQEALWLAEKKDPLKP